MELPVYNMAGEQVSTYELPASIFEANINRDLMHQALVRQLANERLGTHKAKTRSEVNRSTAKIYRQKGTGRARHGSRKAPIFVGGGKAHGPQPRKYTKDMPRKMRRAALCSALSVKADLGDIVLVDKISMDVPKTKVIAGMLGTLTNGERLSTDRAYPKGDPRDQLSTDELMQKFEVLAEGILSRDECEAFHDAVYRVEESDSIRDLLSMISGAR